MANKYLLTYFLSTERFNLFFGVSFSKILLAVSGKTHLMSFCHFTSDSGGSRVPLEVSY